MGKQHEVNRNVDILGGLQRYDLAVFANFSMGKQTEVNRNVEILGGVCCKSKILPVGLQHADWQAFNILTCRLRQYFQGIKEGSAHLKPMSISGRPHMEEKNATLGWQPHTSEGWHSAIQCWPIGACQYDGYPSASVDTTLNGGMPTLRFSLVVGNACGVFFFQGGCCPWPAASSSQLEFGSRMPYIRDVHIHGVGLFFRRTAVSDMRPTHRASASVLSNVAFFSSMCGCDLFRHQRRAFYQAHPNRNFADTPGVQLYDL